MAIYLQTLCDMASRRQQQTKPVRIEGQETTTKSHGTTNGIDGLHSTKKDEILNKLMSILNQKAPEAIPVLQDLISILSPCPRMIVEDEKRERSIVIHGLAECDAGTKPSERQIHTESLVTEVLDTLGIETRPLEVYRMGIRREGKSRLVKVVFCSRRFSAQALKKAKDLRNHDQFHGVFIRRSKSPEELTKYNELRRQAHELNNRDYGGRKVYVVFRDAVVKVQDIPSLRSSGASKN